MTPGRRPSRPLGSASPTGVFGHPVHPALVHLPVGAWVCSLVFDIASQVVHRPGYLALGSQWLIAIGVLGAVAAAAAGLADLAVVARDAGAFRTAYAHMLINVLLIFAYAGNFIWRYRSHTAGAPVGVGMLALSACCAVTLGVSCYLGGKLTYGYGARVAATSAQDGQDGQDAEAAPPAAW